METEIYLFIRAFWYGAMLAGVYDCLKGFRLLVPHRPCVIAAEDLIFWMISSLFLFYRFFGDNMGILRGYLFAGAVLGAAAWRMSVGKWMKKAALLVKRLKLCKIRCNISIYKSLKKLFPGKKKIMGKQEKNSWIREYNMKTDKKKSKQKNKGQNLTGMVLITVMVCLLVCVLVVRSKSLEEKIQSNEVRMEELEQEKENEIQRTDEIDELKEHMESDEFISQKAHDIGLVKDNEILFKENK